MSKYDAYSERVFAQRDADKLTKLRKGLPAMDGSGRVVTRYVVERYGTGWGLVERWRYVDRDDLPEFGGAFVMRPRDMLDRAEFGR